MILRRQKILTVIEINKNKAVLTKDEFVNVVNDYKRIFDFSDDLNDVFDKYGCDGNVFPPLGEDTIIRLLEFIFNDSHGWISYWCWELDFGKSFEDGDIVDEDGNNICLKTPEDLYELLIKNMKENGGD